MDSRLVLLNDEKLCILSNSSVSVLSNKFHQSYSRFIKQLAFINLDQLLSSLTIYLRSRFQCKSILHGYVVKLQEQSDWSSLCDVRALRLCGCWGRTPFTSSEFILIHFWTLCISSLHLTFYLSSSVHLVTTLFICVSFHLRSIQSSLEIFSNPQSHHLIHLTFYFALSAYLFI